MSYENYDSDAYESRIMKEIMIIISIIIIVIFVLAYYFDNNSGDSFSENADTNTGCAAESDEAVSEMVEYVSLADNGTQNANSSRNENINAIKTNENEYKSSDDIEVVPINNSLNIGRIEQASYSIDVLPSNSTNGVGAEIVRYSGNIGYEDQEDWYSFTATYEGWY